MAVMPVVLLAPKEPNISGVLGVRLELIIRSGGAEYQLGVRCWGGIDNWLWRSSMSVANGGNAGDFIGSGGA
jgi:hypothetical protein